MAEDHVKRVLLLHPPYGDFTYPYHSLSYVVAAANAAGYEADVLDLNALWFRSVFTQSRIEAFEAEIVSALSSLEMGAELTIDEQGRYADLLRALSICRSVDPARACKTLTGPNFYDPAAYAEARLHTRVFESLLTILYAPFDFVTAFSSPPYLSGIDKLVSMVSQSGRLTSDLLAILEKVVPSRDYTFVGVSMPFSSNLVPGFALLDAVKALLPKVPRIAGGTAPSDIYKYRVNDGVLAPLRQFCDALYVGEAEVAFSQLAHWIQTGRNRPSNVIVPGEDRRKTCNVVRYVALQANEATVHEPFDWNSHPPHYGWIDWPLYLSPERRVNFSPVRGCFWNRCTFCDYGLNDASPTAPSRTMDVAPVVSFVERLADSGIRNLYLSSDALPPKFLRAFAQGIIDAGVEISWACELYLTKNFDLKFVQLLEKSGLVQASFGLESGSSRVLQRMGKGSDRVETVLLPVLDAFTSTGIALQPLFFFGFPGETDEDRSATVKLLMSYAHLFAPISKGGVFALLSGSMIARNPGAFGIRQVWRAESDEIGGILDFELENGAAAPLCTDFSQFNDRLPTTPQFERPWAGGIDTFHTQLWVGRFGREVFEKLRPHLEAAAMPALPLQLNSNFDVDDILQNVTVHRLASLPSSRIDASLSGDIEFICAPLPRVNGGDFTVAIRPLAGQVAM